MNRALAVIDCFFWDDEVGRGIDRFDRVFTEADPYRGQNANMHLTEAYLAAYEATGDPANLERAVGIGKFIAGRATLLDEGYAWRLPEHFDSNWQVLSDHNVDDKRHPFRPYGTQVGHWLEWSKLLMQMEGLGVKEPWVRGAAELLFKEGMEEGWAPEGGMYYTLDWDGQSVVADKYFWIVAEAIGAANALWNATGETYYLDWYKKLWTYADESFIDHERGGWHHELDRNNEPRSVTWQGKPDLYHVFQATLYPFVPANRGLARWARDQSVGF